MRIVGLAARGAALGLLVASCGTNQTEGAPSSGTTGAGSTAGSTSSTSTGAGGGAAGAIVDMFCNAVADAGCEAEYACCTNKLYQFPEWDPGIDNCKKTILSGVGVPYQFCDNLGSSKLAAYLQAGIAVFDQAQFDLCLALLKSMAAGGAACIQPPMNAIMTTCLSTFRGQIAPGEACPADWAWYNEVFSCKDGICDYSKNSGVCVPFLKAGDACGVYSSWTDATKMCNWVKGEVCHADPGAGDGGTEIMGVCAPKVEIGDTCRPKNPDECRSLNCDDTTSKCVLSDPQRSACDTFF